MTVIAMDTAPEGVRGELTRWFLELKPGVFVGKVNVRIRDLLWERICKTDAADGAVMAYSDTNEQGLVCVFMETRSEVLWIWRVCSSSWSSMRKGRKARKRNS